jgi:hypothetical protein
MRDVELARGFGASMIVFVPDTGRCLSIVDHRINHTLRHEMRGDGDDTVGGRDGFRLAPFAQLVQEEPARVAIQSERVMQILDRVPRQIRAAVIERRLEESQRLTADRRDVQRLDHRAAPGFDTGRNTLMMPMRALSAL